MPGYSNHTNICTHCTNEILRWELRSLTEHRANVLNQAMYGVLHGGVDLELRKQSADFLCALPFDGMAIGGSVGRTREELRQVLPHIMDMILPTGLPNHLLGIGDPESICAAVPNGVDSFDSAYPTRFARHSNAFVMTRCVCTFSFVSCLHHCTFG